MKPSTRSTLLAVILLASSTFADKINITIGYLPMKSGHWDHDASSISGAVTKALEDIKADPTILPDINILLEWHDNKANPNVSSRLISDMKSRVVALFGPTGQCYNEAVVREAENFPVMTYKCADFKTSRMKNFVRFEPSIIQAIKSVISLLRYYKWNRFSLIYEEGWEAAASVLEDHAKIYNMTISHKNLALHVHTCCYSKIECCSPKYWYNFIRDSKKDTRIYVCLAKYPGVPLQEILEAMESQHLFDNGEYIVIYVDLVVAVGDDSRKKSFKYLINTYELASKAMTCPDSTDFKRKAKSVLVVKSSEPTSSYYEVFTEKVLEYNTKPPFNFLPLPPLAIKGYQFRPPIHAAYLYDSIKTYALTLDFLIKEYVKKHDTAVTRDVVMTIARNGSLIADTMVKNSPYTSITGQTILLDEQAESKGQFSLLSFQPMEFEPDHNFSCTYGILPVGQFLWSEDLKSPYPELKIYPNLEINWPNGVKPEDTPVCGYTQEKCPPLSPTVIILATLLTILLLCGILVVILLYRKRKIEQRRKSRKFCVRRSFLES